MILGINLVHRQTTFSEDTGIGLLFVGMLGLGVILISKSATYTGSLTAILFGDVLGVTQTDLVVLAAVTVIAVGTSVVFYRSFLVLSFNEQKAALYGLHPRATHVMLLILIVLSIVGSFQTVGTLLVFGLLCARVAHPWVLVAVLVVVAGMEGALPSVVAGMVGRPIIADLNGDGALDLVRTEYGGLTTIYYNDGNGDFSTTEILCAGDFAMAVAAGRLIPKSILVVVAAVSKPTAARHARRPGSGSPLHTCIADRHCHIAAGLHCRRHRLGRLPPQCR